MEMFRSQASYLHLSYIYTNDWIEIILEIILMLIKYLENNHLVDTATINDNKLFVCLFVWV